MRLRVLSTASQNSDGLLYAAPGAISREQSTNGRSSNIWTFVDNPNASIQNATSSLCSSASVRVDGLTAGLAEEAPTAFGSSLCGCRTKGGGYILEIRDVPREEMYDAREWSSRSGDSRLLIRTSTLPFVQKWHPWMGSGGSGGFELHASSTEKDPMDESDGGGVVAIR
ncbi:hypothetical protein OH76DRAFT_1394909 [Lentinus brumalis]|uniref:Uncharacterized protein n=1 Tax=Lentinus brumalis TaxID=2498619 RepID=A0A371DX50_9APHY|nr:hypothetical protein OH76DRAFT_1394909 [Polyporus brumalis]